MRMAYLILVHKNPNQIKRLVSRLANPDADIFLHIDKKSEVYADVIDLPRLNAHVFLIKKRVKVNWGAFSMIQATLNGLKEIVEHGSYEYIHLLSGEDYPIKSNGQILDYFIKNNGREFIYHRMHPSPELPLGGRDRFEYYYNYDSHVDGMNAFEEEMKARGCKRAFIPGLMPYHGSQWWSLTGSCVRWLLGRVESDREIMNYYRYTKFPDEQFFQTVIMNSDYARNVINNNLRYIDWSLVNWSLVDWNTSPPHPKTLVFSDINRLIHTDRLFARKFDETVDPNVLNTLDIILNNRK